MKLNCSDYKRVLGIELDTESALQFHSFVKLIHSLDTTKRNILKVTAFFYNILRIFSLAATRVKAFFQLLCRDKLDWDEKISLEIEIIWG